MVLGNQTAIKKLAALFKLQLKNMCAYKAIVYYYLKSGEF